MPDSPGATHSRLSLAAAQELCGSSDLIAPIGQFVREVALYWLAYEITGSAWALGILGFCEAAPRLLLGAVGGVIVAAGITRSRHERISHGPRHALARFDGDGRFRCRVRRGARPRAYFFGFDDPHRGHLLAFAPNGSKMTWMKWRLLPVRDHRRLQRGSRWRCASATASLRCAGSTVPTTRASMNGWRSTNSIAGPAAN
jgi:hypothetical protein